MYKLYVYLGPVGHVNIYVHMTTGNPRAELGGVRLRVRRNWQMPRFPGLDNTWFVDRLLAQAKNGGHQHQACWASFLGPRLVKRGLVGPIATLPSPSRAPCRWPGSPRSRSHPFRLGDFEEYADLPQNGRFLADCSCNMSK